MLLNDLCKYKIPWPSLASMLAGVSFTNHTMKIVWEKTTPSATYFWRHNWRVTLIWSQIRFLLSIGYISFYTAASAGVFACSLFSVTKTNGLIRPIVNPDINAHLVYQSTIVFTSPLQLITTVLDDEWATDRDLRSWFSQVPNPSYARENTHRPTGPCGNTHSSIGWHVVFPVSPTGDLPGYWPGQSLSMAPSMFLARLCLLYFTFSSQPVWLVDWGSFGRMCDLAVAPLSSRWFHSPQKQYVSHFMFSVWTVKTIGETREHDVYSSPWPSAWLEDPAQPVCPCAGAGVCPRVGWGDGWKWTCGAHTPEAIAHQREQIRRVLEHPWKWVCCIWACRNFDCWDMSRCGKNLQQLSQE